MFLASTRPVSIRRSAYVPALHSLDRLLDQALSAPGVASATCQAQARTDESGWTLSLDVPGVSKEQLTIGIEGQVVRIESLADAPRQYRHAYELPRTSTPRPASPNWKTGCSRSRLQRSSRWTPPPD
jgi:HSP20 family protein